MSDPAALDPGDAEALLRFVAHALLFAACAAAAAYSLANARLETIESAMWRYVVLATLSGCAYAAAAVGEVAAVAAALEADPATVRAVRHVCQLFFVVLLALSMRELYYESPRRGTGEGVLSRSTLGRLEAAFAVVALGEFAAAIALGIVDAVGYVQLAGSVAFTLYGVSFALRVRADAATTGTVLDTVLTYTIAVLLCSGTAAAAEAGYLLSVPPATVETVASVLTVMSASFLIALTIRLKRNVSMVRPVAA